MKKRTVVLSLSLLFFSLPLAAKDYKQVQTYTNDRTPQPYVLLGQLSEKARTGKSCVKQMAKKAAKKDADALINMKINPTGARGMWFGASVLHCQAVAVRWARPGEQGLTALKADEPVPFIFQ